MTVGDTDATGDAAESDPGRGPDPDVQRLREDGDARLDYLFAADLLTETADGEITPTESFADVRAVYADSYEDVDDETFHETVADLFGIPVEEAAERVTELDLTRWELATYLAVRSDLDADVPPDVTLELAAVMAAAGEASAVPPELTELPAEFERFLEQEGDAVVFVFARECDPCRKMKRELDGTLSRIPDGVAVAGADGADAPDLRRTYEVDVAPTTLVFNGGSLHRKLEGYTSPKDVGDAAVEVV